MKVSIVIPAYNEEDRITGRLDDLRKTLIGKYGSDVRLIIVDDNSTDNTVKVVNRYAKKYGQIEVLSDGTGGGKGYALIKGFGYVCNDPPDIIGFVDADTSYSGTELIKLINSMNKEKADGAIASRYLKGSKSTGEKRTITRYIASRSYNAMVNFLFRFNYRDTQAGAKVFQGKAICSILNQMHLSDMCFDINLLCELKLRNFKVIEVPVICKVINNGTKVDVSSEMPKMFIVTLCYKITRTGINKYIPNKWKGYVYNKLKGRKSAMVVTKSAAPNVALIRESTE
ncbi:MAG: glycosyltransferase [Thaumarchaeota archaeon]|nr:glycosyltransferase [Nitrososphaerota archaeon]